MCYHTSDDAQLTIFGQVVGTVSLAGNFLHKTSTSRFVDLRVLYRTRPNAAFKSFDFWRYTIDNFGQYRRGPMLAGL